MSRMARTVAMCGALLLLAAADAAATVRVGSALTADPDEPACTCTLVALNSGIGQGAPIDGVVVGWSLRTGAAPATPARLQVLRETPDGLLQEVGGQDVTLGGGTTRPTFAAVPQLRIRRGDMLAVRSSGVPLLVDEPDRSYFRFNADVGTGGTPIGAGMYLNDELNLAADVEPDRDDDGYGDDTQDQCPTDAATRDACSGELVGPALPGPAGGNVGISAPQTYVDVGLGAAPRDGVIVRWRARGYENALSAVVLRPQGGGAYRNVAETGFGPGFMFTDGGSIVSAPVRLPVQAGDRLGVRSGSYTLLSVRTATPGADLRRFTGTLAPGAAATPSPVNTGRAMLVNYDLEPDADRDAYGDETQDGCPSDPARQGACAPPAPEPPGTTTTTITTPAPPAPPAPPARVERVLVAPGAAKLAATRIRHRGGRRLAVPLTCPSEAGCRGTVELRVGRTKVGRATFRLGAGQRRAVTVTLSATGARRLRRGAKVTVVLTPAGPAASRRTLTVGR